MRAKVKHKTVRENILQTFPPQKKKERPEGKLRPNIIKESDRLAATAR
jgi:hypothetical protein